MLHQAASAVRRLCGSLELPEGISPSQFDTFDTFDTTFAQASPDTFETAPASPASSRVSTPPSQGLLHPFATADGGSGIEIISSSIDFKLMQMPPRSAMSASPDAVGVFEAQGLDGTLHFRIRYHADTVWRIGSVRGGGALEALAQDVAKSDVWLTLWASPAQQPCLRGENLAGLTLTPPMPPETDWEIRFYGASMAAPCVHAQCAAQGPVATLPLDNTEVRWSNTPWVDRFAFDRQWRELNDMWPVPLPKRAAPAVPF